MPWNCLRSSKEKRKLEISAPIINVEDSQNLQLVPLKKNPAQHYKFDLKQKLISDSYPVNHNGINATDKAINDRNSSSAKLKASKKTKKSAGFKKIRGNASKSEITALIPPPNSNEVIVSPRKEPAVTIKGRSHCNEHINSTRGIQYEKISKQVVSVKFSFKNGRDDDDDDDGDGGGGAQETEATAVNGAIVASNRNPENNRKTEARGQEVVEVVEEINENVTRLDVEAAKEENLGNYDEIPLVTVESPSNQLQESPQKTNPFCRSSDSIPFIDEENTRSPSRKSEPHTEDCHNLRYITLHPQNVGSVVTNSQRIRDEQVEKYVQLTGVQKSNPHYEEIPAKTTSFPSPSSHRSNSPQRIKHEFHMWRNPKGKLCQVCHESLLMKPNSVVKCRTCCLTCHEWCVPSMPSIRYHDTSLIIFRKWLKAHEKLAFPSVYRYVYEHKPDLSSVEHHLTDTECNYSSGNRETDDHVQDGRRKTRRRTRSLEKQKRKVSPQKTEVNAVTTESIETSMSSDVKPQKNDDTEDKDDQNHKTSSQYEKVQLRIVESNSNSNTLRSSSSSDSCQTKSVDIPNHVTVDVHHRPSCDVLVIKESSDYTKDEIITQQKNQNQDTTDVDKESDKIQDHKSDTRSFRDSCSSDKTIVSTTSNSIQSDRERRLSRETCNSPMSTASSSIGMDGFDDDEDIVDYATIDLRKTKNHEDKPTDTTTTISKSQSFPIQSKQQNLSDTLRLHYVTQRILASVLPRRDSNDPEIIRPHSVGHGTGSGGSGLQDKHEKELISMLEQKHGKNYRVFDLESCIAVITLERICELCKHIDSWLGSGKEKVVVLQDRGDRQRLGVAIAAYLEYLEICASNYAPRNGLSATEDLRVHNTITRNWLDLDIFSMKKFLEDFIGPLRIPSHKRYLRYFSGLLSGKIKMNSSPLNLKCVSFHSPPSWLQYERNSSQDAEWNSFIKIYEGLRCIYTSDIHVIPITTQQFLYQIGNLRLRGDIIIKCYQVIVQENAYEKREKRELLFSIQFHTCAIASTDVSFSRQDLDSACDDPRFPNDHKIVLHFNKTATTGDNNYIFQSPLIRTEPPGELGKYDSLENLESISTYHTGPVDGSLYATIAKSPKSPQAPQQPTTRRIESLNSAVISPPPQFSNKQFDVTKRYSDQSVPLRSSSVDRRTTVASSNTIHRSSSISGTIPPNRQFLDNRPGTSQSSYREKRYDPGRQHITIVETFTTDGGGGGTGGGGTQNGARDSVRSPLTLSMDSGISSSGVLNRRAQGPSVSPSSLPSQASPQEDRHRELDDILSDMLMTVQDIPDLSKSKQQKSSSTTTTHRIVRSQSVIPTSGNFVSATTNLSLPFGRDPNIRSQSLAPHETASVHSAGPYFNRTERDRDAYETSSTTTTLTPPPSESGRDTPVGMYNSSASIITLQQQHRNTIQREQREHYPHTTTANNQHIIMDLQHQQQQSQQRGQNPEHHHRGGGSSNQSASYQQVVQTEEFVSGTSEDEENIPYHAREHSRPFTYGPVNNDQLVETRSVDGTRMIKMQSGLSSPSLVRKTFGGSSTLGSSKAASRNDFEEMLRERREKVMSEKYSISDKHKTFDRTYSGDKWVNNTNYTGDYAYKTNGYSHEPLKRSNTIDGGFGRSTSTDGLSGQTWLQLQQQKLRAKKEQQQRDDRRYFEETIHTEIRNRPLRSRANVQRYDGYASDTAAFADEVDYRRPLHVQTPYQGNRSSDRNYQTITTTTTVTQKERPFVTVKRAHEQAKREAVGSPTMSPLSILNASPNGHIAQAQTQAQNGLLSMAEQNRNGHVRLESDNITNANDDSNSTACTVVNYNHKNNNVIPMNGTENSHQIVNDRHQPHDHMNNNNNDKNSNHNDSDQINNNIHNNNNNNHNQHITENISHNYAACGQLVLDRLLASLALETNIINQQLAQTNNGNNNDNNNMENGMHNDAEGSKLSHEQANAKFNRQISRLTSQESSLNSINGSTSPTTPNKPNPELSDVIADLTEFSHFETLRQISISNGTQDSISTHSNSSTNGQNRILHSETENSSSISPSISERSNNVSWHDQVREESFSSYRSETDPELSIAGSPRPETPAFPVTPRTPYGLSNGNVSPALPPKSPTSQRKDLYTGNQRGHIHETINQNDTLSCYTSRRNSNASNANSEPQEVAAHHVKFVKDSSKYWYKPNISREEAVALLRNAAPGTFIVRDSTTFKNAFGLVLRVAHPPPGVTPKGPVGDELVRHFLVEPTVRGVRLKGCANEPVFTSLSALVYQHSVTPLALPCRLIIPDLDLQPIEAHSPAQKQLLAQGAACNVLYLYACETESLTGEEAVRKAVSQLFVQKPLPTATEVHFKVSHQGITLTDVSRQKFFRKHYPANAVSHCGLDPEKRLWSIRAPEGELPLNNKTIFAYVAKRSATSTDNQCHVFCDLSPNQPATAIISFANKVLPTDKVFNTNI